MVYKLLRVSNIYIMVTTRDFFVFLSEYKYLGAYWANYENTHFVDGFLRASQSISCCFDENPRNWLVNSFNWHYTNEGYVCWMRLDTLWNRRCNYLLKNEK